MGHKISLQIFTMSLFVLENNIEYHFLCTKLFICQYNFEINRSN